jgi:hypothetical protein
VKAEEEAESEVKVILMENKLIINLINLYYVLLFYHSASPPPASSSSFPLLNFPLYLHRTPPLLRPELTPPNPTRPDLT